MTDTQAIVDALRQEAESALAWYRTTGMKPAKRPEWGLKEAKLLAWYCREAAEAAKAKP